MKKVLNEIIEEMKKHYNPFIFNERFKKVLEDIEKQSLLFRVDKRRVKSEEEFISSENKVKNFTDFLVEFLKEQNQNEKVISLAKEIVNSNEELVEDVVKSFLKEELGEGWKEVERHLSYIRDNNLSRLKLAYPFVLSLQDLLYIIMSFKEISTGNLNVSIQENGVYEIKELARVAKAMTRFIGSSMKVIKSQEVLQQDTRDVVSVYFLNTSYFMTQVILKGADFWYLGSSMMRPDKGSYAYISSHISTKDKDLLRMWDLSVFLKNIYNLSGMHLCKPHMGRRGCERGFLGKTQPHLFYTEVRLSF